MRRALVCALIGTVAVAIASSASAARYLVVFKGGRSGVGVRGGEGAGGEVVRISGVGGATVVSSRPAFARVLRASGAVVGVAHYAGWKPNWRTGVTRKFQRTQLTPGQATAGCAAFFNPPPGVAGPDPLHVCQWGMHVIHATPAGSYAVNRGQG